MKQTMSLCLAVLCTVASVSAASAQETLKLGASVGRTGYVTPYDAPWLRGIQLAADALNEKNGVLGRKVAVVDEDNKSNPQQAVVDVQKMIASDKVSAFINGHTSAANFAVAGLLVRAQLPMIVASILPQRPEEQKWAFSVLPPPRFEIETDFAYLRDRSQVRKIGILKDPTPYGQLMANLATQMAGNFGLEIVASEPYQVGDNDYSVQLGRIRSAGAGAVLVSGPSGSGLTIAKNMQNLGLKDMLFVGPINTREVALGVAGVIGERYLFPAPLIQIVQYDLSQIQDSAARAAASEFVRHWTAKNADADPSLAARSWDAAMMLAKATEAAKSVDGSAIRDQFEKLPEYKGVSATFNFSPEQHMGVVTNPYVMGVVRDGKVAIAK